MDRSFYLVSGIRWTRTEGSHAKRIKEQSLAPLGPHVAHLQDGCSILLKFRGIGGSIEIDAAARLTLMRGEYHIKSDKLRAHLLQLAISDHCIAYFFEGTPSDARCVVTLWDETVLAQVEAAEQSLRLEGYGLPAAAPTVVDTETVVGALYRHCSAKDPDLFAVHASRFLDAPHIITALFSHVFSLATDDNIRFPIQVKKLAEQLRELLAKGASSVRIDAVQKSHLDFWSSVQYERFAFLDGGVARIPSLAGLEPIALRVGVYSVRPGVSPSDDREQWRMTPFVLGDLIDKGRTTAERPDSRRLHEAARYTLEPLTGLSHLREFPDTRALLLHGPLVNQFVQYDEGIPNFTPFITPAFLESQQITREALSGSIADIPSDSSGPMWNQFMSVYAFVAKSVAESSVPIAGVVERPTGRAVATALLHRLRQDGVVNAAYVERALKELERYDITDDFLFGCLLRYGEYISPVLVQKNQPHRARDRWQPVVRQYPAVHVFLIKTEETMFPFRVEMNAAASRQAAFLARFLFHTARLLPRYAFPVGLDIVDKYAKVPDWIARGISAELSAAVLRRALRTGDAHVVMQTRLLLARGPRDFFFRPSSNAI